MNASHPSPTTLLPSRPSSYMSFSTLAIESFAPTPAMNGLTAFAYPTYPPTIRAPQREPQMCHADVSFELDLSDLITSSSSSRFATSDERSTPRGPVRAAAPVAAPAPPTPIAPPAPSPFDLSTIPIPYEIAPGVLSDGRKTVRHPSVRAFLEAPQARGLAKMNDQMRALCALAVMHRPAHPAHLFFWARNIKRTTAELIQEVLNMDSSAIDAPAGWMGIEENLWFLANLQRTWRVEDLSFEPSRRALRKRKADSDSGEQQAARKRTRMTTRATAKEGAASAPSAEAPVNPTSTPEEPLPATAPTTEKRAPKQLRPKRPLPTRATSASSDTSTKSGERGSSTAVSDSGVSDATAVGGTPVIKLSPRTPALPDLVLVDKPASRAPSTRERRPARRPDAAEEATALGLSGVPAATQEAAVQIPKKRAPRKPRAKVDAAKTKATVKAKTTKAPARPRASKKVAPTPNDATAVPPTAV